ncbi:MAG: hypothetical protein ABI559_04400 [Chloroflexota bacterium]
MIDVRALTFCLCACLLAVAACGDGSDATPSPSPTPDFETSAASAAPGVPLAVGDLTSDWSQAAEGDVGLTQNVDLPEGCNIFDLNVAFPGAFVRASGPALRGPEGAQVTSYAAIYRTADDAQHAIDGTREILGRCQDDYKSAVEKIADDALTALGVNLGFLSSIDVTLDELPQSTADGSVFYRLEAKVNLPGDDLHYTLDATVVRVGRVVAADTYYAAGEGGAPADGDITAALVRSAADAEGALPR